MIYLKLIMGSSDSSPSVTLSDIVLEKPKDRLATIAVTILKTNVVIVTQGISTA